MGAIDDGFSHSRLTVVGLILGIVFVVFKPKKSSYPFEESHHSQRETKTTSCSSQQVNDPSALHTFFCCTETQKTRDGIYNTIIINQPTNQSTLIPHSTFHIRCIPSYFFSSIFITTLFQTVFYIYFVRC